MNLLHRFRFHLHCNQQVYESITWVSSEMSPFNICNCIQICFIVIPVRRTFSVQPVPVRLTVLKFPKQLSSYSRKNRLSELSSLMISIFQPIQQYIILENGFYYFELAASVFADLNPSYQFSFTINFTHLNRDMHDSYGLMGSDLSWNQVSEARKISFYDEVDSDKGEKFGLNEP